MEESRILSGPSDAVKLRPATDCNTFNDSREALEPETPQRRASPH
jgi:hypothetical protein